MHTLRPRDVAEHPMIPRTATASLMIWPQTPVVLRLRSHDLAKVNAN